MRKSRKQFVGVLVACGLVLAMAVGGTMAYLTDAETAENIFTIGKVQIALREPDFPGNGNPGATNQVPLQTVPKDPQVKNTGINDAIVFLRGEIPKVYVML